MVGGEVEAVVSGDGALNTGEFNNRGGDFGSGKNAASFLISPEEVGDDAEDDDEGVEVGFSATRNGSGEFGGLGGGMVGRSRIATGHACVGDSRGFGVH